MTSWIKNTLANLYNALSAPVTSTRDTVAESLQSLNETASFIIQQNEGKTECRRK